MRQLGGQEEALVRLEMPGQGLLPVCPLFPQLATGHPGERRWIRLARKPGRSHGPRRHAGDSGHHGRQFEGGSFEQLVQAVDQPGAFGHQGAA